MLILTRHVSESIIINNDITLTILDIRGHQIQLGIDAPKEVSIHREEIYKRILEDRQKKEDI